MIFCPSRVRLNRTAPEAVIERRAGLEKFPGGGGGRGGKKVIEGANRANWRWKWAEKARLQFRPPGSKRGASGTIIDITCHVNIGYRHGPRYLSGGKRGRRDENYRTTVGEIITCWF